MKQPDFPITIFYDGACIVCATEIRHYLNRDRVKRLIGVDISTPDFKPDEYQIPLPDLMYELHVIDHSGHIYRGVESFWAIWQAFPTSSVYGLLGTMVTSRMLNPLARMLYKGFARIRPYLPKRHDCVDGVCTIHKRG